MGAFLIYLAAVVFIVIVASLVMKRKPAGAGAGNLATQPMTWKTWLWVLAMAAVAMLAHQGVKWILPLIFGEPQ
jgi:hypothetical protein